MCRWKSREYPYPECVKLIEEYLDLWFSYRAISLIVSNERRKTISRKAISYHSKNCYKRIHPNLIKMSMEKEERDRMTRQWNATYAPIVSEKIDALLKVKETRARKKKKMFEKERKEILAIKGKTETHVEIGSHTPNVPVEKKKKEGRCCSFCHSSDLEYVKENGKYYFRCRQCRSLAGEIQDKVLLKKLEKRKES